MPVCVLTCCRVYGGLQGKKVIKSRPKIADFAHKSLKSNLVHLYCAAVVDNMETGMSVFFCGQYFLWPV